MEDFEQELKTDFLDESDELLADAESAFLRLEAERDNPELINEIFRLAHNLKGTSMAVGFDQLSELTHIAENLILKIKNGEIAIGDQAISLLLEFKDRVTGMVDGLKKNLDATFDIQDISKRLAEFTENGPNDEPKALSNVNEIESNIPEVESDLSGAEEGNIPEDKGMDFSEEETHFEQIVEASIPSFEEGSWEEEAPSEKVPVVDEVVVPDPLVQPSLPPKEEVKPSIEKKKEVTNSQNNKEKDQNIRVSLQKIDKLNNVIGELIILQTVISQRRYEFITDDLSNKSIGMMGKLFKETQELAMSLRMLPLKQTFQKMNRIVHDTAKALNKEVNLHLLGEDTEVDKTVLEKIADPLVHIIRNAVDHGLEDTVDREPNGKEFSGNVELMAFHEGSHLIIQITDDGKGINPEVIRKKAIEKKIISENATMTDQEIIQLIFHAGFSTKVEVSEVSGRGVGMDVVKTNIEALGGEVKVMSKIGEGSSFKIILPLTLAIIEGIVIAGNNEKFVVPLSQVHEVVQIPEREIESFSGVAKLFKLRGEVIPLFSLNSKLGIKSEDKKSYTNLIIRTAAFTFGVIVDDILNQQQVVVKKLGEDIQNRNGVMGAAIMADGRPSLILDLFEIFKNDLKSSRGYQNLKKQNAQAA
jgi:two-component system chemotaxis sensor kinase CheA